ncbi:MAG: 3-phosphoshikimate 1-carboxyvinyltransferase [Verrucomicrobiota bacterium]|jgi:3-phosphoshikimate 1-carboxyvinyltransferase
MSLPDLIEIVPLDKPVHAEITVPGSKSITNRALILAALAEGEVTLEGALWSEDTQIMVECLQELGFMVDVRPDPNEFCNRTITVYGKGGVVPPGGTEQQPMELFVGNAGTAARFLSAFVCLGKGVYRVHGIPRMNERPKKALFQALRQLGYRVESPNDKLPAVIYGEGPKPGAKCTVNIEESSQFASALLLCARIGGWQIEVVGENAEESPYVAMTLKLIEAFPNRGGKFQIEPDASSGSYFWGAGWLLAKMEFTEALKTFCLNPDAQHEKEVQSTFHGKSRVFVSNWPNSGWQLDADFTIFVQAGKNSHPLVISRSHDLADSIMTAIVLAPFASLPVHLRSVKFTDLGRLRLQETERVVALRTELTKCGAKVIEEGDTLTVYPSELHGAEIETYNDHRMAMCFAILGLKVPGIKIKNPACVKKTFPNFFRKLAAKPPQGLGATILDAKTGRALTHDELFAE